MFCIIFVIVLCIPRYGAEFGECNEDLQCMEDYYCEFDGYYCRQCLRCEDYKRAPPPGGAECVKSVAMCGGCLEHKSGGSDHGCGPKLGEPASGEFRLPVYAWVLLALIVVAALGGAVLVPFITKPTYAPVLRSENQIPPAANYELETWRSPPPYTAVVNVPSYNVEEVPSPYVKPSAPFDGTRESADRQATVPFDPPNYIRGPQLSALPITDSLSIDDDTGIDNSDGGVISLQNLRRDGDLVDVIQTSTASNTTMSEYPNGVNTYVPSPEAVEGEGARARGSAPLVVVNNNLHVQSVALTGATILLPQTR